MFNDFAKRELLLSLIALGFGVVTAILCTAYVIGQLNNPLTKQGGLAPDQIVWHKGN